MQNTQQSVQPVMLINATDKELTNLWVSAAIGAATAIPAIIDAAPAIIKAGPAIAKGVSSFFGFSNLNEEGTGHVQNLQLLAMDSKNQVLLLL